MLHPLLKNRITVTLQELESMTGIDVQTWRKRIKDGKIEAILEKPILINTMEIERYFESKTKKKNPTKVVV